MSKIDYKCPYQEFSCTKLDSATLVMYCRCSDCEHYRDRVRPTGGIISMKGVIDFFRELKNLIDNYHK